MLLDADINSPYAIPNTALNFQGGSTLYIPAHLLAQSPTLGSMVLQQNALQFTDVSVDAGHVLVHYLFTGIYQCLKSKNSLSQDRLAAEFVTSVRVYNVAQTCILPSLVELAKDEIQKLGKNLQTALIFDLVKDAHPSPRTDDIWFNGYLKAQLRLFLEGPLKPLTGKKAEDQETMSINDLLFKSMFELYHESTVSLREGQNQALVQVSTNTVKQVEEQAPREAEEAAHKAEMGALETEEQTLGLPNVIAMEEEELAALKLKKVKRGRLSKKEGQRINDLQDSAETRAKEKAAQEAEQAACEEKEKSAEKTKAQAAREAEEATKEAAEKAAEKEIEAKGAAAIAEEECEIAQLLDKKHNSFMGLSSKLERRLSQLQAKAMERAEEQDAREAEEQPAPDARKKAAAITHPESTQWLHKESIEAKVLKEDTMRQKDSTPDVDFFGSWGIAKTDATKDDEIRLEAKAAQITDINTNQNDVANTEALGAIKEKEKKKEKNKKGKKSSNKSVATANPTPGVLEGCLQEKSNQNAKDESNMELDPYNFPVSKKDIVENKKVNIKPSASRSPSGDLTDAHNQEARADEDEAWSFWGLGNNKKAKNDTAAADQVSGLPLPLPTDDPKVR